MLLRSTTLAAIALASLFTASAADGISQESTVAPKPSLVEIYKHLHQNPELSRQEAKTAAYLAAELRSLGFTVAEGVGKYKEGGQAFGLVATLENGPGPRLLIRTDLDALPVEEKTGLAFASQARAVSAQGQEVAVMHACGHDLHMTVLLGAARELASHRERWHGTLLLVGQPAEEIAQGAKAMLRDGLYERFGRPDYILSEHDDPNLPAGSIGLTPGPIFAGSTGVTVTLRGLGGHGSQPNLTKDPIVMAAEFVLLAQTIVSRQVDPRQPAVLTVGSIHAGTKNNIIPDEATLNISLRAYTNEVRDLLIAAIERTANGVAVANGLPPERMPLVASGEWTAVVHNDPPLTARLRQAAVAALGAERVLAAEPIMGSEDVGEFALDGQIPAVMFRLGASAQEKLEASRKSGLPLPYLHSPLFAPVYEKAIPTGVTAMSAMAIALLQ